MRCLFSDVIRPTYNYTCHYYNEVKWEYKNAIYGLYLNQTENVYKNIIGLLLCADQKLSI